ncbi:MAG: TIGR02996 domain-containing protein, partial [Planctomycetaceae bacterium]|nr:TIGR02996 domain-containing protein [Planctomycetaceae bacterium]
MPLTDPFIQAIADDPYDDVPRLVFADWLEEQGETERAELIRVQCELEPMRDLYEIERATELHKREEELLREYKDAWLAIPKSYKSHFSWHNVSIEFRRGFPDLFLIPTRTFLEIGSKVLKRFPTIRRLVLFRVHGYGQRLAECKALQHVPELELACWYSDEDAEAIATSPHLSQLQVLELWLGRRGALHNSQLCRIMGASEAWPQLRELTVLNPDGLNEKSRRRLAKVANQAAGREVAVYRRGYPELFPFAADFWYTFPGYLPDGRMAMAAEDHSTDPPSLCVITFNKRGVQTKDTFYVSLPD